MLCNVQKQYDTKYTRSVRPGRQIESSTLGYRKGITAKYKTGIHMRQRHVLRTGTLHELVTYKNNRQIYLQKLCEYANHIQKIQVESKLDSKIANPNFN